MCGNCKHFISKSLISSGTEIKYFGICDKVPEDDPERFVYSNTEVSCCEDYESNFSKEVKESKEKELSDLKLINEALKRQIDYNEIRIKELKSEVAHDTIGDENTCETCTHFSPNSKDNWGFCEYLSREIHKSSIRCINYHKYESDSMDINNKEE